MTVLVDTSVWSLALRRPTRDRSRTEELLVAELSALIREGHSRILGLIRQELLSGIRTAHQYETVRKHLRAFPDEPLQTADHEEAAKLSNLCHLKGVATSILDVLICAVASQRQRSIFSTDPDFAAYARILPSPCTRRVLAHRHLDASRSPHPADGALVRLQYST